MDMSHRKTSRDPSAVASMSIICRCLVPISPTSWLPLSNTRADKKMQHLSLCHILKQSCHLTAEKLNPPAVSLKRYAFWEANTTPWAWSLWCMQPAFWPILFIFRRCYNASNCPCWKERKEERLNCFMPPQKKPLCCLSRSQQHREREGIDLSFTVTQQ